MNEVCLKIACRSGDSRWVSERKLRRSPESEGDLVGRVRSGRLQQLEDALVPALDHAFPVDEGDPVPHSDDTRLVRRSTRD